MKLFTIPLLSQTFVSGLQWKSYEKQQQKKRPVLSLSSQAHAIKVVKLS